SHPIVHSCGLAQALVNRVAFQGRTESRIRVACRDTASACKIDATCGCAPSVIWSVFCGLTAGGIGALAGLKATLCGPIGVFIRAAGDRACPVFALRSGNGFLSRPFYGGVPPRLLLGPRLLAARLLPLHLWRGRGGTGIRPTSWA